MIYFIRQGKTKLVKIGYTDNSETLEARIRVLQTGNPCKLKVIGTVAGDRGTEGLLHALFTDTRQCGEWFKLSSNQIYILSQFKYSHDPRQVLDFTADEDIMRIHNDVMDRVHGGKHETQLQC